MPATHSTHLILLNERGAAVTEMALMLIILVPILFYLFFAGEAGRLLLNSQEEVIVSIWDYASFPFKLSKSPKWLTYDGNDSNKQNLIAAHNRLQYADGDSSFTNEERFNSNTMDMSRDYFSTNAFVQPTHCDGECLNYRHDYDDKKVHEVICWLENAKAGAFLEEKVPMSSTKELHKQSKGGLVVCQEKVRLKNYLIPKKFMPEFQKQPLWEGDKYTRGKKIIDGKSNYNDIVVKHRSALLTDSWAIIESPSDHKDTNTVALINSSKPLFAEVTESVLYGSLLGIPALKSMKYMQSAYDKNLAVALALPTGMLTAQTNSNVVQKLTKIMNGIGGVAGLPNMLALNMVATYSHDGEQLESYQYTPTLDLTGEKLYTTPMFDQYKEAWNNRGKYYLGAQKAEIN